MSYASALASRRGLARRALEELAGDDTAERLQVAGLVTIDRQHRERLQLLAEYQLDLSVPRAYCQEVREAVVAIERERFARAERANRLRRNRWSSGSRVDKDTCAAVFRARLCAAQGRLDRIAPGLRSQLDDGGWDVGDEHQTRQLETLAYLALGALARASRCGLLVNDAHPGTWGAKLLAAWRDLAAESQTGTPAVEPEPEPDADRLCNPERPS